MKKFLAVSLLFSAVLMQASCGSCTQAYSFPDRFHFLASYNHGAPVESVSTFCDCNDVKYVAIAGYSTKDCEYPVSLRTYYLDINDCNKLKEIAVDDANPSDYLYATDMCCVNSKPVVIVGGCPNASNEVVWAYERTGTGDFVEVGSWSYDDPTIVYSVAMNCVTCELTNVSFNQIAVVGKAQNGDVKIYILKYTDAATDNKLSYQTEYTLKGGDLFKAAWLPAKTSSVGSCGCNIPCTILTVGGQAVTGEDCKLGNIHNFAVTCDGCVTEVISSVDNGGVILLGGSDYKVRQLVWNTCCDSSSTSYPYPFLLATADHAIAGGFESKVVVYYYIPSTGESKELATYTLPGKVFAGQFTPGCSCKSVTVAGGCIDMTVPCTANIWNLVYDCATSYPVTMTLKTSTSFDDTITSLAFCQETNCNLMVVTSESASYATQSLDPLCPAKIEKGEIGTYKVNFCKPAGYSPCIPTPICSRKNINEVSCKNR